jgi:2-dehydropantoate 2-reductase
MRYLIFGAGAVGSGIGGRLFQQGHSVTLIARGPHLAALQTDGLTLQSPRGPVNLHIPAVGHPAEARLQAGDRVILTVKGQDTPGALASLDAAAEGSPIAVFCAQNGVDNERQALRLFPDVYAICVMLPAVLLVPGVVQLNGEPHPGILDLGRYPGGVDETAQSVAQDFETAGFASRAEPRVMRLKYAKLLRNLANAIEAATGRVERDSLLYERARAEALACYEAAGIEWASDEEDRVRRSGRLRVAPVDGQPRSGGSTWQSLARKTGAVEADALNGEIVLLGRLHGIPTPVNELLRRTANDLARAGAPPGSLTSAELVSRLDELPA